MNFITPPVARNIGGCQPFKYCPVQFISNIPLPAESEIADEVVFAPTRQWYTGWHRPTTASYEERPRDTSAGMVYDVSYKFFYPGNSAAAQQLFDTISRMKHVLLIEDNNGQKRIVGVKANGMEFRATFNTGSGPDQVRGYQCEFFGTLKKRAPVYTYSPPVSTENDYMEDYVDDYFL